MSETLDCDYCDGEELHQHHAICPRCENAGFDAQGSFQVGDVRMLRLHCWHCGYRFAVEDDRHE